MYFVREILPLWVALVPLTYIIAKVALRHLDL